MKDKNNLYQFSDRKLVKHLRQLDKDFCKIFSDLYELDLQEVTDAAKFL